jgi:type I restriction enzyme S subunit
VKNLAVGGIMAGLSSKIVKDIKFILPKINEQKQFSEIFNSFDEKLEVLTEKKIYYQELKQGLMQQLLTGKIRVNNLIAQI